MPVRPLVGRASTCPADRDVRIGAWGNLLVEPRRAGTSFSWAVGALVRGTFSTFPASERAGTLILLDEAASMENRTADQAILDLERAALDQWSSGNPKGYAQSAAEEVTYIDDIGAQSRKEGLQEVLEYLSGLEGQLPAHRYEMISPKVQLCGDVAVLSFQYHPSSLEGTLLTPWKATTVYRRANDGWRMLHAHWSMSKQS